jgi:iron-sulfur cluster repair protein YtfE (RIC family)
VLFEISDWKFQISAPAARSAAKRHDLRVVCGGQRDDGKAALAQKADVLE